MYPEKKDEFKQYDGKFEDVQGAARSSKLNALNVYKQSIQDGHEPSSVEIFLPGRPEKFDQYYIVEQSDDAANICLIHPVDYDTSDEINRVY